MINCQKNVLFKDSPQKTTKNNLTLLIKIAKEIRPAIVKLAVSNNHSESLRCYCAISSYTLYTTAKKFNLRPSIISGCFDITENSNINDRINHSWVQYYGKIIDLTATQFGNFDDVHITSIDDKMYLQKFYNSKAIEMFNKWPNLQNPLHPDSFLKQNGHNAVDTRGISATI